MIGKRFADNLPIHIHTPTHTHTHTLTHTERDTHRQTHTQTLTHSLSHTRTDMYTHSHTYTPTHTNTQSTPLLLTRLPKYIFVLGTELLRARRYLKLSAQQFSKEQHI